MGSGNGRVKGAHIRCWCARKFANSEVALVGIGLFVQAAITVCVTLVLRAIPDPDAAWGADAEIWWRAARAFTSGDQAYGVPFQPRDNFFMYPPPFLLSASLISWTPLVLFVIICNIVGVLALSTGVWLFISRFVRDGRVMVWMSLVCGSLLWCPVLETLLFGQLGNFLVGSVLIGLYSRHSPVGGLSIAFAVGAKLTPVAALGIALLARKWILCVWVVAWSAIIVIISPMAGGGLLYDYFTGAMFAIADRQGPLDNKWSSSAPSVLFRAGTDAELAVRLGMAWLVLIVLIAAVVVCMRPAPWREIAVGLFALGPTGLSISLDALLCGLSAGSSASCDCWRPPRSGVAVDRRSRACGRDGGPLVSRSMDR